MPAGRWRRWNVITMDVLFNVSSRTMYFLVTRSMTPVAVVVAIFLKCVRPRLMGHILTWRRNL